jgi:DNA-binding GntR family transcriptional regulator
VSLIQPGLLIRARWLLTSRGTSRPAAAILRDGIERGAWAPGRKLPSENELLREHHVARGTIRKAMRVLADEGLAEVVPGRGVYVTERP